jgi:hypothetical protein
MTDARRRADAALDPNDRPVRNDRVRGARSAEPRQDEAADQGDGDREHGQQGEDPRT